MPAAFPGNSTTKLARAAAGGGYESAIEEVVSGTPAISSVTDNGDGTLSISGSSFGTKSRQPAAFVDYGHEAYEAGVLNTTHGDNLVDGSPLRGGTEANQIYAAGNFDADAVTYRTGGPKRHAAHVASYQTAPAPDSWFGEPKSFRWGGPIHRPSRPRYYQANWFYFPDNPGAMWRILISQGEIDAGSPVPGETVTINGFTGIYGGYDSAAGYMDIHFLPPQPPNNVNDLGGETLTFATSGMTFVWPSLKGSEEPFNYLAPGFKFARIWNQPDTGVRIIASISSNDWYMSGSQSANYTPAKVYDTADLEGGKWHLSEFTIDLNEGWAEHKFDGISRGIQTFDPLDPYEHPSSYTMNLWGINGEAGGTFNQQSVESSYCDDSLHRVLISTAPTKADLRIDNTYHYEIQRPSAWSDSGITVNFVPGALPSGQTLYAYVFNDANECNESGYNIGVTV